jgi:hypothetical protein
MLTSQKEIFQGAVEKFGDTTIKRATLKAFSKQNYTAEIFIQGSIQASIKNVPVSRSIPSRIMRKGAQLLIITLDPQNPQTCMVTSVYSGPSAAPNIVSAFGNPAYTTAANDVTNYTTIPGSKIQLQSGPGTILTRTDGTQYIYGTGGGSAKIRIKATLTDTTGTTPLTQIIYLPNSIGWHQFFDTNNHVYMYGFEWPVEVPEGTHYFEVQTRGNAVPSGGGITADGNCSIAVTAKELT